MEYEPVEVRASPEALAALAQRITGFRVEELPGGRGDVSAVWFQADQLYVVTVDIVGLAFMFEVFTLVVKTPAEVLAIMRANAPQMEKALAGMQAAGIRVPPLTEPIEPVPTGELQPWPFRSWRLEVLESMAYIVGPEHLPETAEAMEDYLWSLNPGEAPAGSDHTCLTAVGLLFTSDDGRRLLITADGAPGWMRVTDTEEAVQSYLRQCIVVPAAEYASKLHS